MPQSGKVMMYVFDNLEEMAGFFEHMAVTNRQKAAVARTAKDRNTSVTEAMTFEYAASVIRAQAIRIVEETLQELGDVAVTLMRRQRELAGDPEPTGDAD